MLSIIQTLVLDAQQFLDYGPRCNGVMVLMCKLIISARYRDMDIVSRNWRIEVEWCAGRTLTGNEDPDDCLRGEGSQLSGWAPFSSITSIRLVGDSSCVAISQWALSLRGIKEGEFA